MSKEPLITGMDPLDEKLMRAWELSLENFTDAVEVELNTLVPALIEAGYAEEKPWGDPDWFLWWFTKAGVKRREELEAQSRNPSG